jgi:hypothetical protein
MLMKKMSLLCEGWDDRCQKFVYKRKTREEWNTISQFGGYPSVVIIVILEPSPFETYKLN